MSETMTVTIPACEAHEGIYSVSVTISACCPVCGEKRGRINRAISFDGSRRLYCDGWANACGHIDKYGAVRLEAHNNGLNPAIV